MFTRKNSDITLIITNSPLFVKQHLNPLINHKFSKSKIIVATQYDKRYLISKNQYKFIPIYIKRNPSIFDLIGLLQFVFLRIKYKPYQVISFTPKAGIYNLLTSLFFGKSYHYFTGQRWALFSGLNRMFYKSIDYLLIKFLDEVFSDSFSQSDYLASTLNTKKPKVINFGSVSGVDISQCIRQDNHELKNILSIKEFNYLKELQRFVKEAKRKESLIFGFVGRINKDKGIPILINSFKKHLISFPNSKLILIGPLENNMISFKNDIKSDSIMHINYVQNVFVFYHYFDVFVLPSYREGFGSSIIEAASNKVPSISTNIPGPIDFIEHMINGYLMRRGSSKDLCDAMNFFAVNPKLIKNFGLHSFNKVTKKFDRKIVKKHFYKRFNII